jgi:hypothetical protein
MRRSLPFLLVGAGLLLLLGSLGYLAYSHFINNPGPAPLPESLAAFPLSAHRFGAQAVAEINQLHGLAFPLSAGAVGVYGEAGQATLWVSGAPTAWQAARLNVEMTARIAEGNSPFTPSGQRQEGGRTVYALDGHGQSHFYFQAGKLLVWLAVDPEHADQALAEALRFYP